MELRWRGSRTEAPGGAMVVRTAAREISSPSPLFFSFSVVPSVPSRFVFFFYSFSFVPSLRSLSLVLSLLSPLSLSLSIPLGFFPSRASGLPPSFIGGQRARGSMG